MKIKDLVILATGTMNINQVSAWKCTADYGKYTEIPVRVPLSA